MSFAFTDSTLPLQSRVTDLISRLTLDEKIAQLGMATPAIPRLGIPAYHWWNEALHGVARNGHATVFPQAIALAATWDPELHRRIAQAISTEARAKYHAALRASPAGTGIYQGLTIWSPNINIFRDPRWGRGQETYGECPVLTARFAVAFCQGLQGDDSRHLKTVATLKHFAVHSGPEGARHGFDARPSPRDLWETYLPAFEAGIREGHAGSIMSVYNAVDGVPVPVSHRLLTAVLRERWGFGGAVVGDVDSVHDVHAHHHYTRDAAESAALAVRAGNDLCSGTTFDALPDALNRGLCTESDLDRALHRLFTLRFRLGQFDPPEQVAPAAIAEAANCAPEHDALARDAARASLVLLKNDGTLPLDPRNLRRVAVIGPTADDLAALLGSYAGTPQRPKTLLAALREHFQAAGLEVGYEPGRPLAAGFPANQFPFGPGTIFADVAGHTPGVHTEIWNNPQLVGPPAISRVDAQIDLFWDYYQPQPGVAVSGTSARWSTLLVPPRAGIYRFDVTLTGGARLWIDEVLVLDDWTGGPFRIRTIELPLDQGRPVSLRLELTQNQFTAKAKLGWRLPDPRSDLDRARELAAGADQVILTLGLTPDLEGEENPFSCEGFVAGDRQSLLLPAPQRALLAAIAATGKPITVVLTGGSALSFDLTSVNALLMAWYYGQGGADAVAEALLGKFSPSGRLPVTFYRSDEQLPDFTDYRMDGRTYRYFDGAPLFAFGHGLSYTTFHYDTLTVDSLGAAATVRITNVGNRRADEVIQLYVEDCRPGRPRLQLCGFQRVKDLAPGESVTVVIPLHRAAFRRWDDDRQDYVIDAVPRTLFAGPSSEQRRLRTPLDRVG